VTENRLPRAAFACFILGLALIFLVEAGIARIIGVPLVFIGIALGVTVIADPRFLERDREEG
jgi:disulfide bond formation protein DsbB